MLERSKEKCITHKSNNQCGLCVAQFLPYAEYNFTKTVAIEDVVKTSDDSHVGYALEFNSIKHVEKETNRDFCHFVQSPKCRENFSPRNPNSIKSKTDKPLPKLNRETTGENCFEAM